MADEAELRRRNGSVSKQVLAYFMQYPGQMLHVNTVRSDLGLTDSQVRGAVRKMAEDPATGTWDVNLRGSAWTYHPPKPEREGEWLMVEVLAQIEEGMLVRAEDGTLGIIKPVKL